MDFTFSDEQDELRRTVRGVVERGGGFDQLAELGIVSLLVPEEHGGGGAGLVDMVPVLEELGRGLVPGPFTSSAVFATIASLRLGLTDQLTSLASGTTKGTIAVDEQGHGDPVDRVRTRAVRTAGRWRLRGHHPVVPDAHSADWVLVPARTQEGLRTYLVTDPVAEPAPAWDPSRALARLPLDDLDAEPVGPDGDHTALWRRVVDWFSLKSAEHLVIRSEDESAILAALWIENTFASSTTHLTLLVDSDYEGVYDEALLNTVVRRFGGSALSIEHPTDRDITNALLRRYQFTPRREVVHMRWDVS